MPEAGSRPSVESVMKDYDAFMKEARARMLTGVEKYSALPEQPLEMLFEEQVDEINYIFFHFYLTKRRLTKDV